jgi:hypothetical protein
MWRLPMAVRVLLAFALISFAHAMDFGDCERGAEAGQFAESDATLPEPSSEDDTDEEEQDDAADAQLRVATTNRQAILAATTRSAAHREEYRLGPWRPPSL